MQPSKTFMLGAVAAALVAGPLPAAAGSVKWMTCQFYDSTKNQVIHLNNPFAMGGSVDLDKQYAGFLAAARYQDRIDETSKTEGTCVLSDSEDQAQEGVTGFVNHYKALGAREGTIGFAPN